MRKSIVKKISIYISVILAGLWAIFPFYWALTTSFKSKADVFKPYFVPFIQYQPTLDNWLSEIRLRGEVIMLGLMNSLIAAGTSAMLCVTLGGLAGYALARFRFRRWKNRDIVLWFFSLRFLPPIVVAIPFFLIYMNIGLLDNVLSLILSYTVFFMPFSTLILRDIFKGIPHEVEESALVDGCSRFSVFAKITLPLAAPGLVAAFIICFALAWNEFLFALILTYRHATTIPVVIAGAEHSQGVDFWYICTRSIIAIGPPVILASFVQKWLVSGLTLGAVRGAR